MNILVVSHGGLAQGMHDAATMIMGDQEGFDFLSFRQGVSLDDFTDQLRAKVQKVAENGQPVLVMADIMGGTPSNALATLLGEGADLYMLAGINLPMLLEALLGAKDIEDVDAFVDGLAERGRKSVVDLRKLLLED